MKKKGKKEEGEENSEGRYAHSSISVVIQGQKRKKMEGKEERGKENMKENDRWRKSDVCT